MQSNHIYGPDEPNDFKCEKHGVYGTEWPWPIGCGFCALETRVAELEAGLDFDRAGGFIRMSIEQFNKLSPQPE